MKNQSELVAEIVALLEPFNTEKKQLSAQTDIPAELNIDSVGIMDFIMEVEDKYDIEIPLNVVAETRTIGDLASVVSQRVGAK
jgi:acyl carrier protein